MNVNCISVCVYAAKALLRTLDRDAIIRSAVTDSGTHGEPPHSEGTRQVDARVDTLLIAELSCDMWEKLLRIANPSRTLLDGEQTRQGAKLGKTRNRPIKNSDLTV